MAAASPNGKTTIVALRGAAYHSGPMPADAAARPVRILHLEDSEVDHSLAKLALHRAGLACELTRVETLPEFLHASQQPGLDLILADYRLPGFTALDAWAALQQQPRQLPLVLLTGAIGEAAAVEALRSGIADYLLKDHMGQLERVIARALEVHQARLDKARADAELVASERRLAELAEHLQTSIEQERAAIAREVHDDIGGALAAAKFDLAWIGRHAGAPELLRHAGTATEMVQHAIDACQRIMMNLRPPVLDQGLAAAVQWLAEGFQRRTGIPTRFQPPSALPGLPKAIELAAYRTAQEALTNIAKHAGCRQVGIDLSGARDVLTLEISDDGKGLDPAVLDKPKTFGLKGLSERARTVGGWLDISSRPGAGTSIILSVPLPGAQGAAADAP